MKYHHADTSHRNSQLIITLSSPWNKSAPLRPPNKCCPITLQHHVQTSIPTPNVLILDRWIRRTAQGKIWCTFAVDRVYRSKVGIGQLEWINGSKEPLRFVPPDPVFFDCVAPPLTTFVEDTKRCNLTTAVGYFPTPDGRSYSKSRGCLGRWGDRTQ